MRKITPQYIIQISLIIVSLFSCYFSYGQITFQRLYNVGGGDNFGMSVATTPNGYLVVGNTADNHVVIIRTDTLGDTLWTKRYNFAWAWNIQYTPSDGGFLIANTEYIMKGNANGSIAWTRSVSSTGIGGGSSVQLTSSGTYVFTGTLLSVGGSPDGLANMSSTGQFLWEKNYNGFGSNNGYTQDVRQTSDGYIIVGQTHLYGAGNDDIYLLKTDLFGNYVWSKTFGGTDMDRAFSVQQTTDGGYIICGFTNSFGFKVYLIKTDSFGNLVWSKTYGRTGYSDAGFSIMQTSDGGYVVSGRSSTFSGSDRSIYVFKTDNAGDLTWSKCYGQNTTTNAFPSLRQCPDGGYIITGGMNSNIYLIKTDANGNSGCSGEITPTTIVATPSTQVTSPADFSSSAPGSIATQFPILPGGGTSFIICSSSCSVMASITAAGPISFCNPGSVTLNANTGTGFSYQWRLNTVNISGATSSSYVATAGGNYDCIVSIACGSALSNSIAVSAITSVPTATISAGGPTTFCQGNVVLSVSTCTSCTYQWRKDGVNITGATGTTQTVNTSGNYDCVVTNACGSAASNVITITVNPLPPAVITAAGPTTFCSSGSVTLNANTGTGLTYQWQKNSVNITGEVFTTYAASTSGTYRCIVTNACGSTISNSITVTVISNSLPTVSISAGGPTTFCHQPTSSPFVTNSVTLTATATGSGLSYQWRNGNNNIAGATSTTYVATASGGYNCVVTNVCGSVSSNFITVNVLPGPGNNIFPLSDSTCYPQTAGFSVGCCQTSYQWWGPNQLGFGPISGQTTNWLFAFEPGYYFCVISDGTCYSRTDSVHLTVFYPPAISITAAGPTAFCNIVTPVTLNATPTTGAIYQWKQNNVNIPGATSSSYTATAAGTYTCMAWDSVSGFCSATSNGINVTVVTSAPTATITANGPTTFCSSGSVGLSVNTCVTCTYQWRKDGVNITGATSSTRIVSVSGSYDCVVTNACGSITSNAITVTVNPFPVASITAAGPTAFCSPGSVTLNALTAPGNTYQWRLNNSNIAGATSDSYIATSAGTYTCQVAYSGCGAFSNAITVTVNSAPPTANITAAGPTTFCSPGSVTLNANTGTGLSYQWQLNGSPITGATLSSYSATSTGNYNCIVSNSCGSVTSNIISVTVENLASSTITTSGPTIFCNPGSVTLNAVQNTLFAYQWWVGNSIIPGATSSSYGATSGGVYQCMITNTCGVQPSDPVTITVLSQPPAAIIAGGPTTFCAPGSVSLSANIGSGLTYQWRLNSSPITGATASLYTATTGGNYDCLVSNNCGTTTSNTITVIVNSAPAASITASGPTTFCAPGSVTLNANTGSGLSYQWRMNGINISGEILSSYVATAGGNFDCIVSNFCGSTISNTITVVADVLPSPIVTAAGPLTFCSTGSVTLNVNTCTGCTYQWRQNLANIPLANTSSYVASTAGNYDCLVTNSCGTRTSNTVTVIVEASLNASITAVGPTTFCSPGSVILNANTGTGLSYQWKLNGGNISGATSSSYMATATGNYTCVVSNTCGNATSNIISVTVNTLPAAVITAAGPITFCAPGSVTLNANTGSGLSYQWKLNGGNISGATSSTYNAIATGNYNCVVTNSCGSTTSNTIAVTVAVLPATPGSITGQTTGVCSSTKTYSIGSVSGATGYTWTVPSGASISSGQGTISVNVAFTGSFGSGNISVVATNSCGSGGASSLAVSGVPAQPGTITGPVSVCHNQNNVDYTIAAVTGATTYTWTVPSGTQIKNGQGTTHIRVRFGNSAGNITVRAGNSCGQGPIRTLAIAMPCRDAIAEDDLDVALYPNPATNQLSIINYQLLIERVEIFDAMGQSMLIWKPATSSQQLIIDISTLPNGIYFTEIISGEQKKVLKFIKQQ